MRRGARRRIDTSAGSSAVSAGLADSGSASLATFIAGVSAFQLLGPRDLGMYALVFNAFVWLALVPTNAYLTPVEISVLSERRDRRIGVLTTSLPRGLLAGVGSAVVLLGTISIVEITAGSGGPSTGLIPLALTAAGVLVVSPLQDHARRLFHLADRSGYAALTSAAQLLGVAVALLVLVPSSISRAWIPMGSLFVANVVSLAFAVLVAHRLSRGLGVAAVPGWRHLRGLGGWLFFQGGIQKGANLVASSILAVAGGLVAVGEVEGARVVAQPLFVLSIGLSASLGPRSMETAAARDVAGAHRLRRTYILWLLPIGIGYLAYTSLPGAANVMRTLVPAAYASAGLAGLQVLAGVLSGMSAPHRSELLGLRREKVLGLIEGVTALVLVLGTAATAWLLGPFSIPIAAAAAASIRLMWRKTMADRALGGEDANR